MYRLDMIQEFRIADTPAAVAEHTGNCTITAGCTTVFVVYIAHIAVIIHAEALPAVHTEVVLIFRGFRTHTFTAFRSFFTAVFTEAAGITDIGTAAAVFPTFLTDGRTVGTVVAAEADFIACTAVTAVFAPDSRCTVSADSTIFTETIIVAVFTMLFAHFTEMYAVFTAFPASLADYCTVSAESAVFTKSIVIFCTFHAGAAVGAVVFSIAGGTVASAFRTHSAAFTAGFPTVITYYGTFTAQFTVCTETTCIQCTFQTDTAVRTVCITITCITVSSAVRTDFTAVFAGFAAVIAKIRTGSAKSAVQTESVLSHGAVIADAAFFTDTAVCFGAFFTDAAAFTEFSAVFAVLFAVRTDYRAVYTSAAARANLHTVTAAAALFTPAAVPRTVFTGIAVTTEVIIAVITVLRTFRTDQSAV